ncbi:MAG: hypothetical protein ACIAQZ_11770 [Sedimentisphaeraceae bacterium JB056]
MCVLKITVILLVFYQSAFCISDECSLFYSEQQNITADLNKDCYIDSEDVYILVSNWLECIDNSNPACRDFEPIENLSYNKPVYYSIPPDSPADNTSSSKLTDGQTNPSGQKLDNMTVGWRWAGYDKVDSQGLYVCVDLGENKPIGEISLSVFTDTIATAFYKAPKKITAMISSDGENFYEVKTLCKSSAYGNHLPKNVETFSLDEYTPVRKTNKITFNTKGAPARYVGFRIVSEYFMFWMDEIQVMSSGSGIDNNSSIYNSENRKPFYIGHGLAQKDSIYFGPTQDQLVVAQNADIPAILSFGDYRGSGNDVFSPATSNTCYEMTFVIDLPSDISIAENEPFSYNLILTDDYVENDTNRTKYTFRLIASENGVAYPGVGKGSRGRLLWDVYFGPIYFKTQTDFQGQQEAYFYCVMNDGTEISKIKVPIYSIQIPQTQPVENSYVGLAWMEDFFALQWPDFFNNYKSIGFNTVSTFPRRYTTTNGNLPQEALDFYDDIVSEGLKKCYVESPLAVLRYIDGTGCTSHPDTSVCPSYTGTEYWDDINTIHSYWNQINPDYVFYDIEVFDGDLLSRVASCTRCQAAISQSGLSTEEYLKKCGQRILEDLRGDVSSIPEIRNEKIGSYHIDVENSPYQNVFSFTDSFPNYPDNLDFGMPSWYLAGTLESIHERCTNQYTEIQQTKLYIPWITAGTYGEFCSFKIEPMIYEIFINGGGGVAFFSYLDFDTPLDYYYTAKALKTINTYSDVFESGNPIVSWTGTNSKMSYSAIKSDDKYILMIGNYSDTQQTTSFQIPYNDAKSTYVYNITKNIIEADGTKNPAINLTLDTQEFCLYYVITF